MRRIPQLHYINVSGHGFTEVIQGAPSVEHLEARIGAYGRLILHVKAGALKAGPGPASRPPTPPAGWQTLASALHNGLDLTSSLRSFPSTPAFRPSPLAIQDAKTNTTYAVRLCVGRSVGRVFQQCVSPHFLLECCRALGNALGETIDYGHRRNAGECPSGHRHVMSGAQLF